MKIGFLTLLTLVFVIAKLTGFIAWSWWLVFSPMFLGPAIFVALAGVYVFLQWKRG